MKTLKFAFVIFTTLMFGLMTSTCTRTSVDDPGMTGYAGFEIILSGTANPSTLFINQGTGWVKSNITMRATNNDGTPAPNRRIMMKISDDFGKFASTNKNYAYLTTDAQGTARVQYRVNRLDRKDIGAELLTYIQAVLQDDNRLDNIDALIYDMIPINLVTDIPKEEEEVSVDTFSGIIVGVSPDEDPSDDDIDLNAPLAVDVSFNVLLYNSTGTNSIGYEVNITDSSGIISSPINLSTGTANASGIIVTITIDHLVAAAGDLASIEFVVTSPIDLVGGSHDLIINITMY